MSLPSNAAGAPVAVPALAEELAQLEEDRQLHTKLDALDAKHDHGVKGYDSKLVRRVAEKAFSTAISNCGVGNSANKMKAVLFCTKDALCTSFDVLSAGLWSDNNPAEVCHGRHSVEVMYKRLAIVIIQIVMLEIRRKLTVGLPLEPMKDYEILNACLKAGLNLNVMLSSTKAEIKKKENRWLACKPDYLIKTYHDLVWAHRHVAKFYFVTLLEEAEKFNSQLHPYPSGTTPDSSSTASTLPMHAQKKARSPPPDGISASNGKRGVEWRPVAAGYNPDSEYKPTKRAKN